MPSFVVFRWDSEKAAFKGEGEAKLAVRRDLIRGVSKYIGQCPGIGCFLELAGDETQRREFVGLPFEEVLERIAEVQRNAPAPMRLPCPQCRELHIDEGEFETKLHHTHSCQFCGHVWRPAVVDTVGVRFLPGFRNEKS